jgi:hypothetical protein
LRRSTVMLAAWLAILSPMGLPGRPELAHADGRAEASRHFTLGVKLYAESKFDEALVEFQRAYELAPHPSVLYNIAASHRELSHYAEAIRFYEQFLAEGKGVANPKLLTRAGDELKELRSRIGRVIVDVTPAGVMVSVDDRELGATPLAGPVILAPGRHTFTLRAPSGQVERRIVPIASGDTATVALDMSRPAGITDPGPGITSGTSPGITSDTSPGITSGTSPGITSGTSAGGTAGMGIRATREDDMPGSMGVSASFGSNARQLGETGAPALGAHVRLGSRVVVGADVVLAAWAVIPSLRVRLAGTRTSVHAIAAAPVNIVDEVFVAGAAGLGLRVFATSSLAIRLEALASFAGGERGVSLPVFLGVELWR